nr:hypothetical protein GCM10020241_34400 [Streptoalloteichus tenebrarius]
MGSSWNNAEARGEAPMLSPPDRTTDARDCSRNRRTCVARYAAPPASTVLPSDNVTRPDEPDGGSRFPWRSLNAISRISSAPAPLPWSAAAAAAGAATSASAAASADARRSSRADRAMVSSPRARRGRMAQECAGPVPPAPGRGGEHVEARGRPR